MLTQTVALRDVKFYAYHGYYAVEQLTGNNFIVDIETVFVPQGESENLDYTVNYEVLFGIMKDEMQTTQKLLETVVERILGRVITQYPFLQTATVGIRKINPAMGGDIGHSFVQLSYQQS